MGIQWYHQNTSKQRCSIQYLISVRSSVPVGLHIPSLLVEAHALSIVLALKATLSMFCGSMSPSDSILSFRLLARQHKNFVSIHHTLIRTNTMSKNYKTFNQNYHKNFNARVLNKELGDYVKYCTLGNNRNPFTPVSCLRIWFSISCDCDRVPKFIIWCLNSFPPIAFQNPENSQLRYKTHKIIGLGLIKEHIYCFCHGFSFYINMAW